ncbi:MAG TPA: NINE protein [Gemmatimonadales bacterium]|nr:NINE protein [Gemmatimonadales bacterium]
MPLPDAYHDEPEAHDDEPELSRRSRGVALGLCFFGGMFGLHRFYVEKPKTAIAMICTAGGGLIWWLYDLVLIAAGEFRDSDELPVRRWSVEETPSLARELTGRAEQRVITLEEQFDGLRQQFNDLAERVDFAERMLAQQRDSGRPQLPRPSGS